VGVAKLRKNMLRPSPQLNPKDFVNVRTANVLRGVKNKPNLRTSRNSSDEPFARAPDPASSCPATIADALAAIVAGFG